MRKLLFAFVLCTALLATPATASDEPVAVDEGAIVDPESLDAATPAPTPSPTATATVGGGEASPEATATQDPPPTGNNAAMQDRAAKEREAKTDCAENTSSLLATGGSERVDDERSWAWLPFLVAAVCAALVLVAYVIRRSRAPSKEGQAPPSLLEVVATIVAICAGVAGLAAQFVPGIGVDEAPAPAATMDVRSINARITREEFAKRIGARKPRAALDRREVGNVIWLQLRLKGYRGERLFLQWGSYENKPGGSLIAATTHQTRIDVSPDSDVQTRFQPVWVGYPGTPFRVQFRLLQRNEVREIANTGEMRGGLPRYECRGS